MKKTWFIYFNLILTTIGILILLYSNYQNNFLGIYNKILHQTEPAKSRVILTSANKAKRMQIKRMVMRQTQRNKHLNKQGFISIPKVGILEPIFNSAYTETGLKVGANYANKSAVDPAGNKIPKMGAGNYGVASHNFNDGKTGFSGLQENLNQDAPYLIKNKLHGSNWLNGQPIYLANQNGIYEYQIKKQILVTSNNIKILNPTKRAQVTIISCLYPSTQYKIITIGEFKRKYSWITAPAKIVNFFDLQKQPTNAHVNWYNPGTEEGSNGDAGGTKKHINWTLSS